MSALAVVVEVLGAGDSIGMGGTAKRTLALAFVLCSRLSTMPELEEPECGAGAAASWVGFLETVDEDMMVVGLDLRFERRDR
jgi:hypothetical protein